MVPISNIFYTISLRTTRQGTKVPLRPLLNEEEIIGREPRFPCDPSLIKKNDRQGTKK
jgi:hypothetical protein